MKQHNMVTCTPYIIPHIFHPIPRIQLDDFKKEIDLLESEWVLKKSMQGNEWKQL